MNEDYTDLPHVIAFDKSAGTLATPRPEDEDLNPGSRKLHENEKIKEYEVVI